MHPLNPLHSLNPFNLFNPLSLSINRYRFFPLNGLHVFKKTIHLVLLTCALLSGEEALAQTQRQTASDMILFNGRILSLSSEAEDSPHYKAHQAMRIKGERIAALGSNHDMLKGADHKTLKIDLRGKTVIPGLIDSHLHGIRAALSYSSEVHWIGTKSVQEALDKLSAAAQRAQPGEWLIVAGGWIPEQFKEKRKPTQDEITKAAPNNPVYVQWMYDWAIMSPSGFQALGISRAEDLPKGAQFELDQNQQKTGAIVGGIVALFDRLPKPSESQKIAGTRKFFLELNRLGITGFIDPGGFNMSPSEYAALFELWRKKEMTLRVNFSYFAQKRGHELEEFKELTQLLPMGFGDDWLRFNGIGERVTFGMYNNDNPSSEDKEQFFKVAQWAAKEGLTLTEHWQNGSSVHHLLEVLERVHQETPLGPLRWSIAHLNDAGLDTFQRMQKMGIGWAMQDAMYLDGERLLKLRGPQALQKMPLLVSAQATKVHIGAGTDAHRVANYNPFVALQWMLDGQSASGISLRAVEEIPTREQALYMYTAGSAWLAHADHDRGDLKPGSFADFAVLDQDFMKVPTANISSIQSLMTVVNAKIVYHNRQAFPIPTHH